MKEIWERIGVFKASEQQLPNQARLNGWLTEVEIEEIRRRCERSDKQVEADNKKNEEELDMRDKIVKDDNRINEDESFQSRADEQGFENEEKELLKKFLTT